MTTVVAAHGASAPIIRKKSLSAKNSATLATRVDFNNYGSFVFDEPQTHGGTGLGPSPLQGVLGALCACKSVTFGRTAKELQFDYEGIEFDAAYTIDIRGRQGARDVVPHFQTVKVEATVTTHESEMRLRDVVEETEVRCPVFNLIKDAGVRVQTVWTRKPPD